MLRLRTDEYLEIVRRMWTTEEPFDFEGRFYHVRKAFSEVRAAQRPHVPILFRGASDAAVQVGAKRNDVYALFREPRTDVRHTIERILTKQHNMIDNLASISLFVRFLRAPRVRHGIRHMGILPNCRRHLNLFCRCHRSSVQSATDAHCRWRCGFTMRCLWTGLVKVSGANGNTTALVGTPEQVAEAIAAYYDLGVQVVY